MISRTVLTLREEREQRHAAAAKRLAPALFARLLGRGLV